MLISIENIRPNPYIPNWILFVLFIQSAILFYVYIYSPRILSLPFLTLLDKRVRRELMESKNSFQSRLLMLLNIVSYISFSLMMYLSIKENNFIKISHMFSIISDKWRDGIIFLVVLILVFFIVSLKKISFVMIAHIFDETKRVGAFIFSMDMFLRALGIVFFVLNFIFLWELINIKDLIFSIFFTTAIFYFLILIIKYVETVHKTWIDYLNFILYFCALELIPFLIALKILSR